MYKVTVHPAVLYREIITLYLNVCVRARFQHAVCQGVVVSAFEDVHARAKACACVLWIPKYTMPISDEHDRS